MQFKEFFLFNEVTQVGFQEIKAKNLFGPVYHGTTETNMADILKSGFRYEVGDARTGNTSHGYEIDDYAQGIPAPVHHLGYGVYFTQNESIAKQYQGSGKKLTAFYLDIIPKMIEINFASPNTMMKWWQTNCYDMPSLQSLRDKSKIEIAQMRIESTKKLTECLKTKYDAVLFKGKGFRSLLDGNQICVFDPSRIYMFNPQLNSENDFMLGDRVKLKGLPVAVEILSSRDNLRKDLFDYLFGTTSNKFYSVKIDSKSIQKIKDFYIPQLKNVLTDNPDFAELVSGIMQNFSLNKEEAVNKYLDNYLSNSIKLNTPESLLEKKIPKGQRVK